MPEVDLEGLVARMGLTERTIRRHVRQGKLPKPHKRGRKLMWHTEALDRAALQLSNPPLPALVEEAVEDVARAIAGLDPDTQWRKLYEAANVAANMIGEANPTRSVAEVQELAAAFARKVRARAIALEEEVKRRAKG